MRCSEVKDLLVMWLDGESSPEVGDRIESHLASCPACMAERAALESTGDLLSLLGTPRSADLTERVLLAVRNDPWCRHIQRELVALSDQELSDIEARPVLEHLADCGECKAELADLEASARALAAWDVSGLSVDVLPRLPIRTDRPRGRLRRLIPALAAACALAVAGLSAHLLTRPDPAMSEPPIEVLRHLDLLQADSQELIAADPTVLEVAEELDWLDSFSDEELAMLNGSGR